MKFATRIHMRFGCLCAFLSLSTVMQTFRVFVIKIQIKKKNKKKHETSRDLI